MKYLRYILAFVLGVIVPFMLFGEGGDDAFAVVVVFWIVTLLLVGIYFLLSRFLPSVSVVKTVLIWLVVISYPLGGYYIGLESRGEEYDGLMAGILIALGAILLFLALPVRKKRR